jgi:hypothetical protein
MNIFILLIHYSVRTFKAPLTEVTNIKSAHQKISTYYSQLGQSKFQYAHFYCNLPFFWDIWDFLLYSL